MSKMKPTSTKEEKRGKREEATEPRRSTALATGDKGARQARDAAIALLAGKIASSGAYDEVADQSDQFEEAGLIDKESLEKVPFLLVGVDRREGDFGPYVSCTCILRSGEVVVFNDGGVGILTSLEGLAPSPEKPVNVKGGLKASHYTGPTGAPSTTWYFSGSKPKSEIAGLNGNAPAPAQGRRGPQDARA